MNSLSGWSTAALKQTYFLGGNIKLNNIYEYRLAADPRSSRKLTKDMKEFIRNKYLYYLYANEEEKENHIDKAKKELMRPS